MDFNHDNYGPYYKNGNGHDKGLDARLLHLPSLAIVALLAFCMWGTYMVMTDRGRIDKRIDDLSSIVSELAASVKTLIPVIQMNASGWNVKDQYIWCIQTQAINKDFRCPELSQMPHGTSPEGPQNNLNLEIEARKLDELGTRVIPK